MPQSMDPLIAFCGFCGKPPWGRGGRNLKSGSPYASHKMGDNTPLTLVNI